MRRIALRSTFVISEFGSRGEPRGDDGLNAKPSPLAKSVGEGLSLRVLVGPAARSWAEAQRLGSKTGPARCGDFTLE